MCIVGKYFYFPHPQPSVWGKTIHWSGLNNRMDIEKAAAISLLISPSPQPVFHSWENKRTIKKKSSFPTAQPSPPISTMRDFISNLTSASVSVLFSVFLMPRHLEPCQLRRTCSGWDWLIPRDSKCCSGQHTSHRWPFILKSASLPSHL